MSITNYSFEDAAASPAPEGRPLGWTVTESSTYLEFADFSVFGGAPDEGYPRETFEIGWPDSTQELISTLDDDNSEDAVFDVGPSQQPFEDFENKWATPQGAFEISSSEFAEFNSLDYENFEGGWGTIIYSFSTELTFAQFDSASAEAFESRWHTNEVSYVKTGTPPTTDYAEFVSADTTNDYEDFEESIFDRFFSVDVATDKVELAAHGFTDEDIVYFYPYDDESSLPEPLEEDTPYYVVNAGVSDFEVEIQVGNGSVTITSAGTGTFKVQADYHKYWVTELEI